MLTLCGNYGENQSDYKDLSMRDTKCRINGWLH